jgi:hypothetical protein
MNVFVLGLRVTEKPLVDCTRINIIAEALPNSEARSATKVQLIQEETHYVGKLISKLDVDQTILAIGPCKTTPDNVLIMQPMLIVTSENFDDLLAMNFFIATGGLGPAADKVEVNDNLVTNRSLAWSDENEETQWFKITAWNELSHQLSELAPGTPTIAIGKVSSTEKDTKRYLNYNLEKVLYLPKSKKQTPKKAADPEKGKVSSAAIGSIDFKL